MELDLFPYSQGPLAIWPIGPLRNPWTINHPRPGSPPFLALAATLRQSGLCVATVAVDEDSN